MTSRKKKERCHRKCGDAFKVFWRRYSRCIVFVLLCYVIKYFNSRELFFPRSNPSVGLIWYYHSLDFYSLEKTNSFLLFVTIKLTKWLITYEIYLQYTYSRLKNTNFVFSSTNKNGRNTFLYLIFIKSPETKI